MWLPVGCRRAGSCSLGVLWSNHTTAGRQWLQAAVRAWLGCRLTPGGAAETKSFGFPCLCFQLGDFLENANICHTTTVPECSNTIYGRSPMNATIRYMATHPECTPRYPAASPENKNWLCGHLHECERMCLMALIILASVSSKTDVTTSSYEGFRLCI